MHETLVVTDYSGAGARHFEIPPERSREFLGDLNDNQRRLLSAGLDIEIKRGEHRYFCHTLRETDRRCPA